VNAAAWPLLRKEFRALLPWWAAAAGVLIASWLLRLANVDWMIADGDLTTIGMWAYGIGALVLGAMAVGQEYAHNTLSTLLAQPIDRFRLLLAKGLPLTALLAALAGVAELALGLQLFQGGLRMLSIGWLPLMCALCLTPWLTMICRSPLAGVVYSILVPVILFIIGGYAGLQPTAIVPIAVVVALTSLLMTVSTFKRLQVVGAAQTEVDLVGWLARSHTARVIGGQRRPVWMLITKEFRLQQVTLLAGTGYVVAWMLLGIAAPWVRETLGDNLRYVATIIFGGLVSLLPGAIVSAEERRFGTADWHALLPTRAGLQWGLKVGVAVTLSVGLAAGLPRLLDALSPGTTLEEAFHPALALMLCLSAIYVSSLSRNGLHALLATVPVIAVALAGFMGLIMLTFWLLAPFAEALKDGLEPLSRFSRANPKVWSQLRMWVPLTSIGVLLMYFAARNHATTEQSRSRVGRQAVWMVMVAWGSAVVLFIVDVSRGMVVR